MRVLIAPDDFKGSLNAGEAAAAMAAGWLAGAPDDEIEQVALSDGGPGFLDALAGSVDGRRLDVAARDPLGRPIAAQILLAGATAYVESARACGLGLVEPGRRHPESESTAGVADLLRAAHGAGVATIVVGLGGSATNDAGAGLLDACGLELQDDRGRRLEPIPARLNDLHHLDLTRRWQPSAELIVATDVDNPLLGPEGATAVYGAQKGVRAGAIEELDATLAHFVDVVARDVGGVAGFEHRPGAGAAGGLGYGMFVLGAGRRSGIELVLEATHLADRIARADVVLTGEGSFDEQSLHGKAVSGVAGLARACRTRCIVLAGRVTLSGPDLGHAGVAAAYSAADEAGSESASMTEPVRSLRALAKRAAQLEHA